MEQYGKILLIAMPAFLLLVLFEKWYGWRKGKDTVRTMDMISSLGSGVTNVTKDVAGLTLVILSYPFLLRNLAITHIQSTIAVYIIAFFALDLAGYWLHRLQHVVNFFWNGHINNFLLLSIGFYLFTFEKQNINPRKYKQKC